MVLKLYAQIGFDVTALLLAAASNEGGKYTSQDKIPPPR